MAQIVTYGEGGYDPTKPNNNIIAVEEVPDPPTDPVKEEALAKLAKLGLTEADIQALFNA